MEKINTLISEREHNALCSAVVKKYLALGGKFHPGMSKLSHFIEHSARLIGLTSKGQCLSSYTPDKRCGIHLLRMIDVSMVFRPNLPASKKRLGPNSRSALVDKLFGGDLNDIYLGDAVLSGSGDRFLSRLKQEAAQKPAFVSEEFYFTQIEPVISVSALFDYMNAGYRYCEERGVKFDFEDVLSIMMVGWRYWAASVSFAINGSFGGLKLSREQFGVVVKSRWDACPAPLKASLPMQRIFRVQ